MWTKDEVARSINELGLAEKLVALPKDEAHHLFDEVETRFSDRKGATWIWEHFLSQPVSRVFEDDTAFSRLRLIVPSETEELILFPGSDETPRCAYRGTIGVIAAVLSDCPFFEYCIIPRSIGWLLCETTTARCWQSVSRSSRACACSKGPRRSLQKRGGPTEDPKTPLPTCAGGPGPSAPLHSPRRPPPARAPLRRGRP